MKYILADDIYYSQVCIRRTIESLRPDLQLAGVAEDSQEMMELLANHEIDFILAKDNISDVNVVSFMRSHKIETPLILISQLSDPKAKCRGLNIIDCIFEPVSSTDLQTALGHI
ncbi:MAG: hypothetical protein HDR88_07175 [Bacteroides sp.]|nr:hypothetical protein [Bacteroides sp.]